MGVRRHPVVPAAILSDFVVRAIEIAAAINRGRHGTWTARSSEPWPVTLAATWTAPANML